MEYSSRLKRRMCHRDREAQRKSDLNFALWLCASVALSICACASAQPTKVDAVLKVGMVADDIERSIDFYTRVLDFKKTSEGEVAGEKYENLYGIFGVRAQIVELKLGDETIELTEFLTPRGKLIPRDSRSNDRWFQHIAIV